MLRVFPGYRHPAVEQGSLARSLRAQAHDARDAARRSLLEIGGKAEIAIVIPVVFIIMPLTVVFTVFLHFTHSISLGKGKA